MLLSMFSLRVWSLMRIRGKSRNRKLREDMSVNMDELRDTVGGRAHDECIHSKILLVGWGKKFRSGP